MARKGTPESAHDHEPEAASAKPLSRAEELRQAAVDFIAAHHRWQNDPQEPNPPEAYWDACVLATIAFDCGDVPDDQRQEIPAECHRLKVAVDELYREGKVFDERSDVSRHYPHKAFWKAVEGVEGALKAAAPPEKKAPLESMAGLFSGAENNGKPVSVANIAKIWGCTPADVEKELKEPGSVCTPEFVRMAEAKRFRPTTKTFAAQVRVDSSEVGPLLEGGMNERDVAEATGVSIADVMRIKKSLRAVAVW